MLGLWETWNAGEVGPYGLSDTYRLGVEWLEPCSLVEDWGCGRGYMRKLIGKSRYRGIDGSGRHADVTVDLTEYRSDVPGIFIRHVLEHNYRWSDILVNACASFRERMFLAIFTPVAFETVEIAFLDDLGVPDISFAAADIEAHFEGLHWAKETLPSPTQYGTETIYRLHR